MPGEQLGVDRSSGKHGGIERVQVEEGQAEGDGGERGDLFGAETPRAQKMGQKTFAMAARLIL